MRLLIWVIISAVLLFLKPALVRAQTSDSHPCALVQDNNGSTINIFCSGPTNNPIQQAIDFAKLNSLNEIKLEPGTFWINSSQLVALRQREGQPSPDFVPIGIWVPSDIHLVGSKDQLNPSIIKIAGNVEKLNAMVFLSGDKMDPHVVVSNVGIEYIELDGKTDQVYQTYVGLHSQNAFGIDIINISVHDTELSGIVLGFWAQYEKDPLTNLARVYYLTGTAEDYCQVTGNYVHNVGGDGVNITGKYVEVSNNVIEYANREGRSNGIVTFTNTSNINITGNTVRYSYTGIGSDGSYPLYDPTASFEDIDEAGKQSEIGFNSDIVINNNILEGNTKGIVLWRSKTVKVLENQIIANKESGSFGISFLETYNSWAAGNTVRKVEKGLTISANGYSPKGSVYDGVGVYPEGSNWLIKGNSISETDNGILIEGPDSSHLAGNTVRGNIITNTQVPCDYSKGENTIALDNQPSSCDLSPSQTPSPISACRADVNGDRVVNLGDIAQILGKWGVTSSGCSEDINGDGIVNLADLQNVLSLWGQTC